MNTRSNPASYKRSNVQTNAENSLSSFIPSSSADIVFDDNKDKYPKIIVTSGTNTVQKFVTGLRSIIPLRRRSF